MKANGKEPKLAKKKQPVFSSRTNLPSTQDTRDKQDMKIRAPTNFQHPEDQPTRMGQEKEAPNRLSDTEKYQEKQDREKLWAGGKGPHQ